MSILNETLSEMKELLNYGNYYLDEGARREARKIIYRSEYAKITKQL